jgi:uncharacterized protein YcnI
MRAKATGWLVLLGVLVLPTGAQAHVSLHPNTLPAGSFPTLELRVPSEEESANTSKVAVQFPPGFLEVTTGYLPGWKAKVLTTKLATPVKTDEGTITEQVRQVTWSGGKIPPETFLDFPISATIPDDAAGKSLTFKTVQTYDNGKVSRWIGAPSAEEPAPTVNVTQKGGVLQDVAGTEFGPGNVPATSQPASTSTESSSKGASKGLGIAALVVAIVALVAGLIALMLAMGRRSRTGAA